MINKIKFEIIETDRLKLYKLDEENYPYLFTDFEDEELMKFFGYETEEELATEKDRYHDGLTSYRKSFVWFIIKLKETGKTIGSCGYHTWHTFHSRAEIGYSLLKDEYKGKGYMKETITPIIKYGFENMNLQRIEALVGPDNEPSLKLMQHFGFVKEGHLREHYFKNGKHEDSVAFSLLKSEYLPE